MTDIECNVPNCNIFPADRYTQTLSSIYEGLGIPPSIYQHIQGDKVLDTTAEQNTRRSDGSDSKIG